MLDRPPRDSGDRERAEPVGWLDRVAAVPPGVLLGIAWAAFLSLSLLAMSGDSLTVDEVLHIPAGYQYLKVGDFRMNSEHPPLAKILAAIPLVLLPCDDGGGDVPLLQQHPFRFIYENKVHPDRLIFCARLPMLLWGLLILFLVYRIARELYGPPGGLIALTVTTFSPNLLAHSHLVHTDAGVSALILLTLFAFWKFLQEPGLARAVGCGLALGGALAVKYSAVMLLPALAACYVVHRRASKEVASPSSKPGWAHEISFLVVSAVVAVATLWAVYGFRYGVSSDPSAQLSWGPAEGGSWVRRASLTAREYRLLPEAYLFGFTFMYEGIQSRLTYALGQYTVAGWWWYFPFAFLVKTPLPTIILMAWGITAFALRLRQRRAPEAFIAIPLVVYWLVAVRSPLNIGVRHILPVYPLMGVLAGGIGLSAADPGTSLWKKRAVLALLGTTAAGCLCAAPYFLSYFNLPSLLVWKRHEMLVDSNLDWGQDLGRLKRFMERAGIPRVHLAYFGNASPRQLGLDHQVLPGFGMYHECEKEWKPAGEPAPGDYVAIGATCLVGFVSTDHDYYFRKFGRMEPVATVGHSIFVYRIAQTSDH